MCRASLSIAVAIIAPSSDNIKSPQRPDVSSLRYRGQEGDRDPLSHTVPRLYGRVKVRAGDNIVLLHGQSYPIRGLSVISRVISMCTSPLVNILSMNMFRWGVCGVVYSNLTFSFSHAFCHFDWCSPALSQRIYLTVVPHDVIFSKNSSIFFGSCNSVFVKKLQG